MLSRLLKLACGVVLCITLSLGLWPFHVPRNGVTWLVNQNGLHFDRYSTVFSAQPIRVAESTSPLSATLDVWLQPGRIWDFSTFLAFYNPASRVSFSLRQSQLDLLLQSATRGEPTKIDQLLVPDAFHRTGPSFLTITTGLSGTVIYVDGRKAKAAQTLQLPPEAFSGRVILGDAAEQSDDWRGDLLGFAIYSHQLDAAQVARHFATWTRQGKPAIDPQDATVVLYLFDQHAGTMIHTNSGRSFDLVVPEKYTVLGQLLLEGPLSEYLRSTDFWGAVAKNIVGFIPLGFCFYAFFSLTSRTKYAGFMTVAVGLAVSFTIELLQWFLPMRDSGTTDLITNSIGTGLGAILCYAVLIQLNRWAAFGITVQNKQDRTD